MAPGRTTMFVWEAAWSEDVLDENISARCKATPSSKISWTGRPRWDEHLASEEERLRRPGWDERLAGAEERLRRPGSGRGRTRARADASSARRLGSSVRAFRTPCCWGVQCAFSKKKKQRCGFNSAEANTSYRVSMA